MACRFDPPEFSEEYPVEVHYNTIDTSIFKPTPSDFRERYGLKDKFIVLGVANVWEDRKGLFDFYKLAEMLDDKYTIVLVGLSEKQIKDLPQNIKGIQRTNSPQELAAIYTAADVFVNIRLMKITIRRLIWKHRPVGRLLLLMIRVDCRETIHTDSAKVVEAQEMSKDYIRRLLYDESNRKNHFEILSGGRKAFNLLNFGGFMRYSVWYYRRLGIKIERCNYIYLPRRIF